MTHLSFLDWFSIYLCLVTSNKYHEFMTVFSTVYASTMYVCTATRKTLPTNKQKPCLRNVFGIMNNHAKNCYLLLARGIPFSNDVINAK